MVALPTARALRAPWVATLIVCVVLAAGTGTHARSKAGARARLEVSPVQKVLQLISDFQAKVKAEVQENTKIFETAARFCDDEAAEKQYAIKGTKERIEGLAATIVDSKAGIDVQTTTVEDLSTQISDTEKELADAVALREGQHADFVDADKELVETVQNLAGAQATLKKSLSFMQANGGRLSDSDEQAISVVAESLGQIAEAAFVTTQQRQQIESFFQEKEDGEDGEGLTLSTKAGGNDAIIDTVAEMEEKAEGALSNVRKEEMEAAHAHAMLKQGIETELKTLKEEMGQSTQKKGSLTEALSQAEKDLGVEKRTLAQDQAYLRDLKHDCQSKARAYETETKDSNEELKALASARAILDKKFSASFMEVRSTSRVTSRTKRRMQATMGDADSRASALRIVEQLGKKFHSTALVSLAYRAAADPFSKVRGMIEDMIGKLLQEAAEEATQKAFCDKEITESKASKKDKEEKLAKIDARLGTTESTMAKFTEEIRTLSKELADSDGAVSKAISMRNEEKAVFVSSEKELAESEEACAAAISVLREYYEGGASLIQMRSRTRRRSMDFMGAAETTEGDGSGIIGILEVAESDFATSLAEIRSAESEASSEYDKFIQDNRLLKATKEMAIKGKESEVKSLKMAISENQEDRGGIADELDAVMSYYDKLKPQCETKSPSYEETKARREQEIEGLKEALGVLAGEGVPASLLQLQTTSSRAERRSSSSNYLRA